MFLECLKFVVDFCCFRFFVGGNLLLNWCVVA